MSKASLMRWLPAAASRSSSWRPPMRALFLQVHKPAHRLLNALSELPGTRSAVLQASEELKKHLK